MRLLLAALFVASFSLTAAAEKTGAGVNPVDVARIEFQDEKFDAALAIINESEKKGTLTGRELDLRGCVFLEQKKFDEALAAFRAAHEKDPSTYALLHLGDAFRRQQKWEEAREAYSDALKNTNILITNERLRFGLLIARLGAQDEAGAKKAVDQLPFPTESAAYYYAQSAWAFAHGAKSEGEKWRKRAEGIHPAKNTAWFERHLYEFGWLKTKPALVAD